MSRGYRASDVRHTKGKDDVASVLGACHRRPPSSHRRCQRWCSIDDPHSPVLHAHARPRAPSLVISSWRLPSFVVPSLLSDREPRSHVHRFVRILYMIR
jgi:hypothetical protein